MTDSEREQYDLSVEANIRDAEAWKWKKPNPDEEQPQLRKRRTWQEIMDQRLVGKSQDWHPY